MSAAVGVVGHVEWGDFITLQRLPEQGAIVHADGHFEVAAGGGAAVAVGLRELAGTSLFLTAVGDDANGLRAVQELTARGVEVHAASRPGPQRRVVTLLDADRERTILIIGERLEPAGADALPWERCAALDGVFLCAGDAAAARAARRARVLVATPRAREALQGIRCDVLAYSAGDADEAAWAQGVDADVVAITEGAEGGRWQARDGSGGRWAPAALPGPARDSYGCGDHFAAGLTHGLAAGMRLQEALAAGAQAGARALTRSGPYESARRNAS